MLAKWDAIFLVSSLRYIEMLVVFDPSDSAVLKSRLPRISLDGV